MNDTQRTQEHITTLMKLKKRLKHKWDSLQWRKIVNDLEKLSTDELRVLATNVDFEFAGGNRSVKDQPEILARHQFIYMLLIKSPRLVLLREYKNVTRNRAPKHYLLKKKRHKK